MISAVYGSGTRFADVTYRVNELLSQPGVEFFARPEWLRADPTPGWNKALVIVYEAEGRRRVFSTGEGGAISLDRLLSNPPAIRPQRRSRLGSAAVPSHQTQHLPHGGLHSN